MSLIEKFTIEEVPQNSEIMPEAFSLKWEKFQSNVSKSFGLLRNEDYLHDVTLVGDDHQQVSAHKLVLSACSEYFRDIFKNNNKPNVHPLLCLNGVSSEDINNVMDYIYNGEVQMYQASLQRFLDVAQRLKLGGIMDVENQEEDEDPQEVVPKMELEETEEVAASKKVRKRKASSPKNAKKAPVSSEELNEGDDSTTDFHQKEVKREILSVESKFQCGQCDKVFSHNSTVHQHIRSVHEGVKYGCNQCDHQFSKQTSLARHVRKVHDGIKQEEDI